MPAFASTSARQQGDQAARRVLRAVAAAIVAAVLVCPWGAVETSAAAVTRGAGTNQARAGSRERDATSLESAAAKAGDTGRAVAMSLIGLAFAVAGVVLAFRRDFKEAAGVFAVGIVAVLLATPTGVALLRDTVTSLFGS
jgi:hypothetical protein